MNAVAEGNNWLDYVTAIGTLLASVGALAAVGITLYLSIWRARQRQPQLSLALTEEARVGTGYDRTEASGPTALAPVHVSNAFGKKSAHRVEVLLSAGYWVPNTQPPRFYEVIHQEPLTWWISDPPQGMGRATVDIPPGVTRKAVILLSGHPISVCESLAPREPVGQDVDYVREQLGLFTVVPLSQETIVWLDDHLAYEVRLTVVADDVDAVSYRTRLRWVCEPFGYNDAPSQRILVHPVWDDLVEIDSAAWPGGMPLDISGKAEKDPFYA